MKNLDGQTTITKALKLSVKDERLITRDDKLSNFSINSVAKH